MSEAELVEARSLVGKRSELYKGLQELIAKTKK